MRLSTKMLALVAAVVAINWTITFFYWQWLGGMQASSAKTKHELQDLKVPNVTAFKSQIEIPDKRGNHSELSAKHDLLAPESPSEKTITVAALAPKSPSEEPTPVMLAPAAAAAAAAAEEEERDTSDGDSDGDTHNDGDSQWAIPKINSESEAKMDWDSFLDESAAYLRRGDSKLKWFVYDMPERFVPHADGETVKQYSEYAAERQFYHVIRGRRVKRAEKANIFYVPVFVSAFLAGENPHLSLDRQASSDVRKAARELVLDAISWVRTKFPYWDRSSGSDHVFLFSHENGPCLDIVAERAQKHGHAHDLLRILRNSLILSHTGDLRSGCYEPAHTVVVPPWVPSLVHLVAASTGMREEDLLDPKRKRPIFLYFRDKTSLFSTSDEWQGIRLLYGPNGTAENEGHVPQLEPCIDSRKTKSAKMCETAQDKCKEAELFHGRAFSRGVRQFLAMYLPEFAKICTTCAHKRIVYSNDVDKTAIERSTEMFGSSFCLCVRGLADWNVRVFEALLAGCIPVIVSDDAHLPFQDLVDWSKISIRVREAFAQTIYEKLVRVTEKEMVEFRKNMRPALSSLMYPSVQQPGKAVDRAEDLLWNLMQRRAENRSQAVELAARKDKDKPYPQAIPGAEANTDICLAIQMTPDRIAMLAEVAKRWEGSIFAIVLMKGERSKASDVRAVRKDLNERLERGHLNAEVDNVHIEFYRPPADWKYYPVNTLRNLALQGCAKFSQFAMTVDVDFVPNEKAYSRLQKHAASLLGQESPRRALVVPAFETTDEMIEDEGTLEELLESKDMIVAGYEADDKYRQRQTKRTTSLIWPFDQKRSPTGHRATNSDYWMRATAPYKVDYKWGWEPYLLVRAPFPVYDETFVQYGQNKVMYAYELLAAGFEFVVVPDTYLVHAHVDPNKKSDAWRPKKFHIGWSCWADFVVRVQDTYGVRFPTPCWGAKYVYPEVGAMYEDKCITNPKGGRMIQLD